MSEKPRSGKKNPGVVTLVTFVVNGLFSVLTGYLVKNLSSVISCDMAYSDSEVTLYYSCSQSLSINTAHCIWTLEHV